MPSSVSPQCPIGVFDSGLGGLTIAAALARILPSEQIIYLGDTARVPYGGRSKSIITRFACEDTDFLLTKGVKCIVVACNTVSANAMAAVRSRAAAIGTFGMIDAGVDAVIRSGARSVAILGTRATILSEAYPTALLKRCPELKIRSVACPLFVPVVEEGLFSGPIVQNVIDFYLHDLLNNPPDAVLLGCTHYPLLKNALSGFLPPSVKILDCADTAAMTIKHFLEQNRLTADESSKGSLELFVTDYPAVFREQAEHFLQKKYSASVHVVTIS